MAVITKFGIYSGLVINWSKSSLMPLDGTSASVLTQTNIPISVSFKYVDIHVTPPPSARLYTVHLNLMPLLACFRNSVRIWSRLKMSLVGRTNLIKMILMPQLLYVLHNSPVVIPLKKFCIIHSIYRNLAV